MFWHLLFKVKESIQTMGHERRWKGGRTGRDGTGWTTTGSSLRRLPRNHFTFLLQSSSWIKLLKQMFNSMCKCSSYCANVQRWCAIIGAYQVQAPIRNVKHKISAWEICARIISKVAAWPQTWLCWKMILHEKPDNQYPHCLMSFIGKSARQHLSDSLLSTQRQMSVRTHFHIMEIHANTI